MGRLGSLWLLLFISGLIDLKVAYVMMMMMIENQVSYEKKMNDIILLLNDAINQQWFSRRQPNTV